MQIEHIPVTKTARCVTHGTLSANTKYIWLVLHGYAQLATDFITPFESLNEDENFVIAVEGLNRFYFKGFSGNVGATWMTREDRENDIKDNIAYINQVATHFKLAEYTNAKIIALGFSQGVATLTRWVANTDTPLAAFVLYAGEMAEEYKSTPLHPAFTRTKNIWVYGDEDPLLGVFDHNKLAEIFTGHFFRSISFHGAHQINKNSLADIISCIE